jgi:two-component system OmpR family sensor kinase
MVWFVLTISGLFVLAVVALWYRAEVLAERQLDNALTMTARAISGSLVKGTHQITTGGSYYFTLVDRNGQAVIFSDNLSAPLQLDKALLERSIKGETVYGSLHLNDVDQIRVVYLPVSSGVAAGDVLVVGVPENVFGDETRGFVSSALIIVVALLILSAVSAFVFAKRTADPIKEMTSAAQRITAQNLNEKLPKAADDDEVGGLVNVLNDMLSRLDSAFMAQRRFSSRVAHELRTPLTILKGETQVTLNRRRSLDEYEAQLLSVLEEVAKMERTIDDLLLFARYESGESEMPFRPVRLDSVVANAAKDLRPLAERRHIEFKIEADENAFVLGDEKALSRLVCKLVENALNYTPENGRIDVTAIASSGQTVLIVKDNGVGIAEEDLQHIFERFFRSKNSRNMHPAGTGIGLSLVEVIAGFHDASINVDSQPGIGSQFTVTFPTMSDRS